jgi:hypothetical protein
MDMILRLLPVSLVETVSVLVIVVETTDILVVESMDRT